MSQEEDKNISHLLQNNDVPTPVEAGRVYDEIDDLETEANALRLQLDALEGRLQQRRSIVSSVRRMPAEVLGEIFQLAVTSNGFGWRKHCLENFMLVCKAWRNVALITHALWNDISIGGPRNSYRKILAWLSRSGSLSKSLEVAEGLGYGGFCGCEDSEPCRYTDPIIIRVLKEARALQDIRLHVGRHICLTKFFESLQSSPENPGLQPWKHIKSIGIDFDPCSYNSWPTPLDSFQSFFTHLAFVTSFRLYLPPRENTSFENSDPWNATIGIPPRFLSQLLELTIQCDWRGSHVLGMLEHCTSLETLTVDLYCESMSLDDLNDPVMRRRRTRRLSLPNLQTLILRRTKTMELLDYLETPLLANMDVGFYNVNALDTQFSPAIFTNFLDSSRCIELKCLSLRECHVNAEDLSSIIGRLPYLRRLTLEKFQVLPKERFWASLIPDPMTKTGPLPLLETLEILSVPYIYSPGDDGLYQFMISRRQWSSTRVQLRIAHVRPMERKRLFFTQVNRLKRNGVFLHITEG